ncbi:MAG: Gfo/Idh/MocA family oxidoreductase [Caldilineaceae bacterium]
MNNHPLAVALIGAGNIATRHLANLQFLGDNRVAAICDIDHNRATALAGPCGANVHTDWQTRSPRNPNSMP